ncbi:hypothetical protein [Natrinema halophilum]|uniref:hypothetical protein n=1 Tax=Natrinema halophilum TaxID=1699371 RepID=UPI001F311458|nr:hypothetical protein [Natrinema halophilum]UHQ96408.1 hypothetical protein HYG82_23495 [Natrinema halophilum]
MSKPNAAHSIDSTQLSEAAIRAFEKNIKTHSLPVVSRAAVVGELIHAGRTLERANHAITVAHRSGEVAQVRAADRLYLLDPEKTDDDLVEKLRAYLEATDEPDEGLIGAVNARVQELRNDGGDS